MFTIPTLPALIDRIKGDLNARMGNTNALIPRSLSYVLAYVLAGATWGLYLYQQWIARQVIPDTAEGAQLERWARLFGLSRNPAVGASGTVGVQGAAGSDLLDGSILQRADSVEYAVAGDYHWTSNATTPVAVEAVEPGTTGNFEYATDATLDLVSPPAGIVSTCPLEAPGLTGGQDAEKDASLLDRLLTRLANPPQGGAAADYVLWAQSTPTVSVDLVWPMAFDDGQPLGEVLVLFTVEDSDDEGAVLPTWQEVIAVYDTIAPKAPVTAIVGTFTPLENVVTLAMTAGLLPGYTLAQVKGNVRREVQATFRERAELDFSSSAWTVRNSRLLEAIGRAAGIDWFELTDVSGAGPTADVDLAAYEYPTIVDTAVVVNGV
jgi:uncharacterized phage protein gp47/JayE